MTFLFGAIFVVILGEAVDDVYAGVAAGRRRPAIEKGRLPEAGRECEVHVIV